MCTEIIENKAPFSDRPNDAYKPRLTDDFKNSLIVRSTEVLNDLNVNPIKKLNKFEVRLKKKRNKTKRDWLRIKY